MNTADLPKSKLEAIRYFADEEKAHAFLVEMRWPEGVTCAHCESADVSAMSVSKVTSKSEKSPGKITVRRLWNCKSCKKQFTAKVNTIFHDSPIPLSSWLPAIWMLVNAKNGVSSHELARDLDVSQKSAWHMSHRIRAAMHNGIFNLAGEVEADETYIGGAARFMHKDKKAHIGTGSVGKIAVAGLLERSAEKNSSRVKLKVLRSLRNSELQGNVRANVVVGSAVYTDALRSYQGLSDSFVHSVVDHAECYARGAVHTNSLENFWSLLKRSIKGTYVCPAPYHLFRYLDEQATRFNERKDTDAGRFQSTMRRIGGRRLTYKKLTGKDETA